MAGRGPCVLLLFGNTKSACLSPLPSTAATEIRNSPRDIRRGTLPLAFCDLFASERVFVPFCAVPAVVWTRQHCRSCGSAIRSASCRSNAKISPAHQPCGIWGSVGLLDDYLGLCFSYGAAHALSGQYK